MSKYLSYTDKPETLLNKGFKYNGYAYEHTSVGEYGTPKLTIHFKKQNGGLILFNYCAPVDVDAEQLLSFLLKTRNEADSFFYNQTKFGDIGRFRWHHKFGVISSEDWHEKMKKASSISAWFDEIEDLEGFTLSEQVLALRAIIDSLTIVELQD